MSKSTLRARPHQTSPVLPRRPGGTTILCRVTDGHHAAVGRDVTLELTTNETADLVRALAVALQDDGTNRPKDLTESLAGIWLRRTADELMGAKP